MPVSSPSYFPPQRATDRIVGLNAGIGQTGNRVFLAGLNAGLNSTVADLIVIGSSAADAGLTDPDMAGIIAIGTRALGAHDASSGTFPGSSIAIGLDAAAALTNTGQNVVIGARAMQNAVNTATGQHSANVIIGYQALMNQNSTAPGSTASTSASVIIGAQAFQLAALADRACLNSVVIGAQACDGFAGVQMNSSVVIGMQAARVLSAAGFNVLIGHTVAAALTSGRDNVCIGQGANLASTCGEAVVIGATSQSGSGAPNSNTLVGFGINRSGTGVRNIVLGRGAGNGDVGNADDRHLIETFDGVTRRSSFYSNAGTGNTYLSRVALADRDLDTIASTNALKLPNGTRGAGNPANGGFFYAIGGVLHFVQSDGTDITLQIGSAAGVLASTSVALANGAAAAAGTLNNAPAAGNPTKWIPISDNGVTRHIPAW